MPGLAPWEANSERIRAGFTLLEIGGNCHFCLAGTDGAAGDWQNDANSSPARARPAGLRPRPRARALPSTGAVAGHDQKLNLMQQTMSFLTHDLTQMMPRPVRGDQAQREPALLAGAGVLASESEGMRFCALAVNPLMRLPRSNLLTVGYRIHDGYLERLALRLTDAAGSVKPTMQKLIPADSPRLQFTDGTRWQESWSSVQAIPVAVRMTLHSPQWGEIERIWLLTRAAIIMITSPPKRGMALVVVLVLLAVMMLVTITLSGGCSSNWKNAQPAGVPAGAVVQRQCRKPGAERAQSEPEK